MLELKMETRRSKEFSPQLKNDASFMVDGWKTSYPIRRNIQVKSRATLGSSNKLKLKKIKNKLIGCCR